MTIDIDMLSTGTPEADGSSVANALMHDGFAIARELMSIHQCEDVISCLPVDASKSGGIRGLLSSSWCQALVARLRLHPLLCEVVPDDYVAVQCTYFTKSRSRNWLVPIHQDFSIQVAECVAVSDLRGWSRKQEGLFVQAPVELLERLVAIRIHLDPCGSEDGPLRVIPGSHRSGVLHHDAVLHLKQKQAHFECLADVGDAVILRPLLLHMSSKATGASLRRVLHFVFAPRDLPYGLRWLIAV